MRLIAIERDGLPATPTPVLPAAALDVCRGHARRYESTGFSPPWTGYLALSGPACIGSCGFKAPPADGRVEIACFTFPGYEGLGFATQMARALVDMALLADPSLTITAQTLPADGASCTILRKLGFVQGATAHDAEAGPVWEWRLPARIPMNRARAAMV